MVALRKHLPRTLTRFELGGKAPKLRRVSPAKAGKDAKEAKEAEKTTGEGEAPADVESEAPATAEAEPVEEAAATPAEGSEAPA